jgi:hypothetical protein
MEINKLTDLSIGAGEGNRTLVFSLEGFRRLNTVNARSDKSRRNCSLKPNRFSFLSERDQQMFYPPGRLMFRWLWIVAFVHA